MHDAELRRNPVQHLAHAHANGMKCATATAADLTINVEQNVLARQMIGQRLAPVWRIGGLCCDRRTALPDAGDLARRDPSSASACW